MRMTFATDQDGLRKLAIFVSQLVREGVTFTIIHGEHSADVELTGGY